MQIPLFAFMEKLSSYDFVFDTTGRCPLLHCHHPRRGGSHRNSLGLLCVTSSRKYKKAAKAAGVEYQYLLMIPSGEDLEVLAQLSEEKLHPVVDSIYELEETRKAVERLMDGHVTGKVMVRVKQE
ncbi:hypothetical protein BC936DRAFT_148326 [Jimgerdemannia flammicorona]|uniref:Alcohol dehydrogenase-like C-terminal domain-containing protein n=1 Tax=Jimgerdemannia flammicorona TaxID=994334 RepID=A0A433D3F2_9FUNG|nr:hypothetical protein BC936DRAFT_148326 [Jimgerdemannia flammicorona]